MIIDRWDYHASITQPFFINLIYFRELEKTSSELIRINCKHLIIKFT
jgi:hypothetical protein